MGTKQCIEFQLFLIDKKGNKRVLIFTLKITEIW